MDRWRHRSRNVAAALTAQPRRARAGPSILLAALIACGRAGRYYNGLGDIFIWSVAPQGGALRATFADSRAESRSRRGTLRAHMYAPRRLRPAAAESMVSRFPARDNRVRDETSPDVEGLRQV